MTIVAAYKFEDSAIFISDFRNTSGGSQTDVSLKFMNIGDHIGLFLSGDALFWERTIPLLQACNEAVTINNAMDKDEPFYQTLSNAFWEQQPTVRTRAIGFAIDDELKRNTLFSIDIQPGIGVRLEAFEANSCLVIGSGSLIRNIETRLSERVRRDIDNYGDDLYSLADGMRKEVQQGLLSMGSSSFQKLGISPFMALHSLAGSHFMVRGENIQGEFFGDKLYIPYNYSFTRNEHTGEVKLEDHLHGLSLTVNQITNLQDALSGDIFDPEQLALGFDPEQEFSNHDFVYVFHQWVTKNLEENAVNVYRSIKKIQFVTLSAGIRVSEPSRPIFGLIEVPLEYLINYPDCRDQYFLLTNDDDIRIREELNENLLFNHEWLSSYFNDYYKIFFIKD